MPMLGRSWLPFGGAVLNFWDSGSFWVLLTHAKVPLYRTEPHPPDEAEAPENFKPEPYDCRCGCWDQRRKLKLG